MTIDEAIAHAREVARQNRIVDTECNDNCDVCVTCKPCKECAEEHEQLAEWLEELKVLREQLKERK